MYTWGQIRLLLQQFAPGVSLDAIDAAINARYGLILSLLEWKGLEKSATIESVAAITAGTCTVTQGSAAVQGQATNWTSAITGMQLLIPGNSQLYTATFVDASDLTLDRPFEGETSFAGGYTLLQSIYALPADCRTLRVITSPVTGLQLDEWTESEFADLVGFPDMVATATMYKPVTDLVDPATGYVTAQRIQLYPLPTLAQGYPIVYEQIAAGFDGVNTSAAPLPFVSDAALLAGAKAHLLADAKDYAGAEALEAVFQKHLTGMLHVEDRKRVARAMRMAPIYTRHRTARILRGFGGTTIINDGF